MKFKILILVLLYGIQSCQSQNFAKQQQTNFIPLDTVVRYGKLDNGFTYYIRKSEEPENHVYLKLLVKAGSIHEDEDQVEYAHLLEHLLSGKTRNFPNISDHFRKSGGYVSAHTGSRLTTYELIIPSQDKQIVKDGIQVLFDWGQGLQWDPKYIAVQRGAIQGEMRAIDPYRNWLSNSIEREVLKNTSFKIYSDEKRFKNLQNFNPKAFRQFYKDWYRPDLQAAVIVGDINVDSIEHEIKRQFSHLKIPLTPKNAKERLVTQTIHLNGSNRFSTVTDSVRQELKLNVIHLQPNFEGQAQTKGDYQKMLLQQLYSTMLERKARQLEEQYEPPFSNFSTRYGKIHLPDRQLHGTIMSLELDTINLEQMKKQFQSGLIAWKQMHLSLNQSDLKKAKIALLKNYSDTKNMESNSLVLRYGMHFLYGKAAPHPEVEGKLVSEILSGIGLKDIQEFILEYGDLNKNTIYIFLKGTKVNMPEYEIFKNWTKETDTVNIKPLPKVQTITTLTDVVDIPSFKLMEEVEIIKNEIGVSTVELSHGVTLVLKPTAPRRGSFDKTISIQAFRPNMVPVQNRLEYLAAKVAPEVLQFTGAGPYTKFELDRFKREMEIQLDLRTDKDNQMVYATSKIDELPELFNLFYLYLKQPRKDPKGFNSWKSYRAEHLEGKGLRGSEDFIMEKITASWFPKIPVLGMGDLDGITMEQVFKASDKWFSSIENFTFIVTGDFNTETLVPVLVNTLSAFPIKNKPISAVVTNFDFPLKKIRENLEYRNIDEVYVRLFFPIQSPRDIKSQVELRLLSKALNQRINDRLRIGSYSPTARGEWLDVKEGIYAFRIDFDSALGNENKMLGYALEEFRKLRENGVEKEWLETAIINELRSYEGRFGHFGHFNFWPDYLQLTLEEGKDPVPGILNYGTLLEHFITQEDINTAAKKYMKEEHLQQFLVYPEGYQ